MVTLTQSSAALNSHNLQYLIPVIAIIQAKFVLKSAKIRAFVDLMAARLRAELSLN